MNIQKNGISAYKVGFSGHKKVTNKNGYETNRFYYLYDKDKYNCYVEIYELRNDGKGNYSLGPLLEDIPLKNGSVEKNIKEYDNTEEGFAYRFRLEDKTQEGTPAGYAYDNGSVIGIFDNEEDSANKFNVVLNNRAVINKNGPMQLIMPDGYNPGVHRADGVDINTAMRAKVLTQVHAEEKENVQNAVRTHANKLGGNFYGIIERLPELSETEGIKRIVGTPFTKDEISSHKYWTENAYQVSKDFGTLEDFKILQTELFKNGINWISDAALVNEGYGGIHMSELMRKGSESYASKMFRASDKISLGILPDKGKFTRMKIINAPFVIEDNGEYKDKNKNYDPKKPTYIQFYDNRLASKSQKDSDKISDLTTYERKNTDNVYDITHHDDAVYPFPIEVDPYELERNIKMIAKDNKNKVDLTSQENIMRAADFSNFNVVNKSNAGGIEFWDGNVDIAKLRFYIENNDDETFAKLSPENRAKVIEDSYKASLYVRDYAVNSGKYWTKVTADTVLSYIAELFKNSDKTEGGYKKAIEELVKDKKLPKEVTEKVLNEEQIIKNVIDDNYQFRKLDSESDEEYGVEDYIIKQAMEMPLETIPANVNLLGILTSPYIAKKANTEEELGVSRYDLYKEGNPNLPEKYESTYTEFDKVYKETIAPIVKEIVNSIHTAEPISDEEGNVTEFGRYVLSEIVPDITKFIIIKSLSPDSKIGIGEHLDFSDVSNNRPDEITMQSIGIPYNTKSEKEEAQILISKIKSGAKNIKAQDKQAIAQGVTSRYQGVTAKDFKMAEMIMDRTEAGLGWRIDAAKDIASIDGVRKGVCDIEDTWDNVIDFWKKYNEEVLKINPHAYTTAEITDLQDLYDMKKDAKYTKYLSAGDAERKFLEKTGITCVANYNYFFSLLPEMFSLNSFESPYNTQNEHWKAKESKNFTLRGKLDEGWCHDTYNNPGFLFQSPDDGVINSYTFIGNHDKPRVLHCLGLDMGLYYSDFTSDDDQKTAAECLQKDISEIDFKQVKPAAIAMGKRLNDAFKNCTDADTAKILSNAVSHLASGLYKGRKFDAEAFGTRPIDIAIKTVIDDAEYCGAKIPDRKKLESEVLKSILLPAMDRYKSMYKLLIALPGSPTDFAGDREGNTGFETKAKNYHQQNRNVIHWNWLNENNDDYKYIQEFYNDINKIAQIRSRKELSALNDGSSVTLPIAVCGKDENGKSVTKNNEYMQAILRYNDEDSVVLTLHDLTGSNAKNDEMMNRKSAEENAKTSTQENSINNRILFNPPQANAKQGLKFGLTVGTKFRNANDSDNNTYIVSKMNVDGKEYYYLKCTYKDKDGNDIEKPITIKPEEYNTLILYKE